jgi:hypothetical protein
MRTPRGGTPLRERRSSITFVDDNSRQGSDVFDDQRFGGAHLQLPQHSHVPTGGCVSGLLRLACRRTEADSRQLQHAVTGAARTTLNLDTV